MRYITAIVILITLFSLTGIGSLPALAQTTSDGWQDPVNLSHSGSTIDPRMIVDGDGRIHVFWQDEYLDSMYSVFSDGEWSKPAAVELPFEESLPKLAVDENGYIAAVWLDLGGVLYSSRTSGSLLAQTGIWEAEDQIAPQAMDFDLKADSNGDFHLAYVRTDDSEDAPAGIYYLKSEDGGASWSVATPLYYSRYLRSLNTTTANVNLSVADVDGSVKVYLSWDDRELRRIYYAASQDGGETWENPVEFYGPVETETQESPFNLTVLQTQGGLLAVWQANLQSDFDCSQYYQLSKDQGKTWEQRVLMFEDFVGCPKENQFYTLSSGISLMYTVVEDGVFLMAWDGSQWSEPQAQSTLFSFVDPETFMSINLGCRELYLTDNDQLLAVGCDTVGNKDIWFTSKSVGDVSDWFPPPQLWSSAATAADARLEILTPSLVTDLSGREHIFWTQIDQDKPEGGRVVIYHTSNEADTFQIPNRVLASPDGKSSSPSIGIDRSGRMVAVWSGDISGELFFSWADAELANSDFEWAEYVKLPVPRPEAASPMLLIGSDGTLYVAYAIRFNEERGIYLVLSTDDGATWSEPVKVFDAVSAGWEMVDMPRLVRTGDGTIHVLWTRNLLPGYEHSIGLYYSRSIDGGKSFSTPETILEIPVVWSALVSGVNQVVHRFWLAEQDKILSLNHQISLDAGQTWGVAENLTRFGELPGPVAVKSDASGNLHVVEAVSDEEGKTWLKYTVWDGAGWLPQDGLELTGIAFSQVQSVSFDLSPVKGELNLSYSLAETDAETKLTTISLYGTRREVDLPQPEVIVQPAVSTQIIPTPEQVTEQPIQATATITKTAEIGTPTVVLPPGSGGSPSTTGSIPPWAGLALGVGLGLLAIISLYFVVRVFVSRAR